MIFLIPWASRLFIYLAAALLPALYLMRYIYRKDKWEPEPLQLLVQLVLIGVLAALVSVVLELVANYILRLTSLDPQSPLYMVVTAFLGVAAIEEGAKYFFLYRTTWNNPNFNFRFHGIVYAAFVSLGFAAYENVHYVFSYGLSVAIPRALLAIPGHLAFSVVFGCFYAKAKKKDSWGQAKEARANLITGYVLATLLHGFYDACTMIGTNLSLTAFLLFVAILYLSIFRLISRKSDQDGPL